MEGCRRRSDVRQCSCTPVATCHHRFYKLVQSKETARQKAVNPLLELLARPLRGRPTHPTPLVGLLLLLLGQLPLLGRGFGARGLHGRQALRGQLIGRGPVSEAG